MDSVTLGWSRAWKHVTTPSARRCRAKERAIVHRAHRAAVRACLRSGGDPRDLSLAPADDRDVT